MCPRNAPSHSYLPLERVDEAENTIVMLSDWLELDSQDEWVRCDAETVQNPAQLPYAQSVLMWSS